MKQPATAARSRLGVHSFVRNFGRSGCLASCWQAVFSPQSTPVQSCKEKRRFNCGVVSEILRSPPKKKSQRQGFRCFIHFDLPETVNSIDQYALLVDCQYTTSSSSLLIHKTTILLDHDRHCQRIRRMSFLGSSLVSSQSCPQQQHTPKIQTRSWRWEPMPVSFLYAPPISHLGFARSLLFHNV